VTSSTVYNEDEETNNHSFAFVFRYYLSRLKLNLDCLVGFESLAVISKAETHLVVGVAIALLLFLAANREVNHQEGSFVVAILSLLNDAIIENNLGHFFVRVTFVFACFGVARLLFELPMLVKRAAVIGAFACAKDKAVIVKLYSMFRSD
jgi:hypothetical protein